MFGRVNVIARQDFVFRLTKSVMMDAQPVWTLIPSEAVPLDVIAPGILIPPVVLIV